MPGMPERRTHDYVRNGLTTLFAIFDTDSGKVISSLHRRHRAAEFRRISAARPGCSSEITAARHNKITAHLREAGLGALADLGLRRPE